MPTRLIQTTPRVIDTTFKKNKNPNTENGFSSEREEIPIGVSVFTLNKTPMLRSDKLTLNGQVLTYGLNKDYYIENKSLYINNVNDYYEGDILIVTYLSAITS